MSASREYFARAGAAFEQAAGRHGLSRSERQVAGVTLRLHFAGDGMKSVLLPALAHLPAPARRDGPALDLRIWEGGSTGVAMPPPEWPFETYLRRGEIAAFHDSGIRASFSAAGPVVDLFDGARGAGFLWAGDCRQVPQHERGAPARRVLGWWLEQQGLQMVHAGAVATRDGGVLLAGKGGSGKSNTALACLAAGLLYLADDYCVLERGDPPVVHSLYCSGKVFGGDLDRLPQFAGAVAGPDPHVDEKALLYLSERHSQQLRTAAPLNAIVLLQVRADAASSCAPASAGDAVGAVAMSTIAQTPYAAGEVFRTVATIARQVPCFRLDIGFDAVERVPDMIRAIAADGARR